MPRREHHLNLTCVEDGCKERTFYVYDTMRERAEGAKRYANGWRCVRHTNPDEVVGPNSEPRDIVITAAKVARQGYQRDLERYERAKALGHLYITEPQPYLPGLFWLEEGKTSGSGFTFGPGFKLFADDFPEGARVVLSIRVELPAEIGGAS